MIYCLTRYSNYKVSNISARVVTRFVSESGADTDGCGETAETACRMMSQILAQLLAQKNYAPPDLILRLDEVWNKAIDDVAFLFSKQEYPGPDNDYCKLLYLPTKFREGNVFS